MEVCIEKLDHFGLGICYVDGKVTFVDGALPGEVVDIKIVKVKKKYQEAKILKFVKKSSKRKNIECPYFSKCGGCKLLSLDYDETLSYKKQKVEELLKRFGNVEVNVSITPSNNNLMYRNKITLKVKDGNVGYFEEGTHQFVKISNCLLAENAIQKFLEDVNHLHINNGELIIRANYNDEILVWLKGVDSVDIDIDYLKQRHKIVGIVLNDKVYYGDSFFVEKVGKFYFRVSYNSFFQINRFICGEIFKMLQKEVSGGNLLDLYCGVGSLGIVTNAENIYGIEVVQNAICNAIVNAKINHKKAFYLLGDVSNSVKKIKDKIDVAVIDPPRAGVDKETKQVLLNNKIPRIIYISCDPVTLARDLKDFQEVYVVETVQAFDMFPFTYHVECLCLLSRKDKQ